MSTDHARNMAASVRQRLLNRARAEGEDFQVLLTRYALERFLYRLSLSEHKQRFVLKGAMLFVLWEGNLHRPTRDLDLLGFGSSAIPDIVEAVRDVCTVEVEDDGVLFHADTVAGALLREDQEYEGVRVTLQARLGTARIPLQIDVGFGDVVTPEPEEAAFPVMLDASAPVLKTYPPETVVAEKLQAMVLLGIANSRMKDFYDVVYLARHFSFDGVRLAGAIRATFERRGTPLPNTPPLALSDEFAQDTRKRTQWRAFLRRLRLADAELDEVIADLRGFLLPPLMAAHDADAFLQTWTSAEGWT